MFSVLAAATDVPPLGWLAPFVAMLLAIAVFPLVPALSHWWEHNRNRLIVSLALAAVALVHFLSRDFGVVLHNDFYGHALRWLGFAISEHDGHLVTGLGPSGLAGALANSVAEYVPFITLLFTLYCVAGGISIKGDIPAHPTTNTAILAIGGLLASFIGTTGAAMLLIRLVLQTNKERKHVTHTVVFFIFIVCNVGGCLLPIGDPPLFLGYLKGVPFFWTLVLWQEWLFVLVAMLTIYWVWDSVMYRRESLSSLISDESVRRPITIRGKINLLWLVMVVLVVAFIDPSKALPGTNWRPPMFAREVIQLALVGLSFLTTPRGLRSETGFNFHAIGEVAALFIGIFITMQIPLEILHAKGDQLGLSTPTHFFWATGLLSAFLDNAPTYAVFFQTAQTLAPPDAAAPAYVLLAHGAHVSNDLLVAVSLGAVFMGAMTYIGNGPNFMVKAIAEGHGVRMPGFFGFLMIACVVLIPVLIVTNVLFL
jgi:Na+/H+ antiporter NhaD/arsenite permease-like protein